MTDRRQPCPRASRQECRTKVQFLRHNPSPKLNGTQQRSFGPGRLHEARSVVRSTVALAIVTGVTMLAPSSAHGQNGGGSTAAAFGGAALGATSGSMLGLLGGLEACNRTLRPSRCSRIATVTGAAIGVAAGAVIGSRNESVLDDRLGNAVLGAALGAGVGLGLKEFVQHYEWPDVAAVPLLGFSIGASAKGSGLGLAAGAATGLLLWSFHPSVGPAGVLLCALAGLAVGGMGDWVADAVEGSSRTSAIPIRFSVPL